MEMKLEEAQVCRLCGQCESIFIDVFGEEGTKRFLGLKIHTKVNIVIDEEDPLPKAICVQCLGKLEFVCDFQEECLRTQQELRDRYNLPPLNDSISENDGLPHSVCMRCIGTLEFIDEFQQNCLRTQRNFDAAKKSQQCPRIKVSSPSSGGSKLDDAESDKENASPILTPSRKRKRPASTLEDPKILKPLALSTNRTLTISINESDRLIAEKSLGKSDQKKTPLASHNPACSPTTKTRCDVANVISSKSTCSPSTKPSCDSGKKIELPGAKIPDDNLLRSPEVNASKPRKRVRESARAVPEGCPNEAKTTVDSPRSKPTGVIVKLEKTDRSDCHGKSNENDSIPIERVKLPEAERPKSSRIEAHHDECPIAGDEAGKRVEKSPESSASRAKSVIGVKSIISLAKVQDGSVEKPEANGLGAQIGMKNVAKTEETATTVSTEKSVISSTVFYKKSAISSTVSGEKSAISSTVIDEKSVIPSTVTDKKSVISSKTSDKKSVISSPASDKKSVISSIASDKKSVISSIASDKKSVISSTILGEKSVISSTASDKKSVISSPALGEKSIISSTVFGQKSVISSTEVHSERVPSTSAAKPVESPKSIGLAGPRSIGRRSVAKAAVTTPTRQRRALREPRSVAKKYAEENNDDDPEEEEDDEMRKKFGKISDLITAEQKEAIEKFYTLDMSVVDEEVVGEKIVFLDRRTYGCKICKASYPRQDKCQVHIWGHLGMRPYRCNACEFATVTVSNIRCHIRKSHLKIKPYACELCEKRYVTAFLLEEHMNTHTGSRPYGCDLCNFTSASRQVLSYHKSTHKTVKDITCHVCGKEFYSKGRMRAHMVIHNKDKAANMCKLCSIYLCNSEALERHHANVHSQDYVCNVCGKRCKSKKALGNHQNVHSAAKYKCNLCTNVYKSSHILKEHLLKHKGIRKYKCNVCSKDFAQQSHLAAHMAVHSEKRFLCPGCNRPFNRHDNMKMHTKRCEAFLANPELSNLLTIRRSRSKPADESRIVDEDTEKSSEIERRDELPSESENFSGTNSQQIKLLAVGGPTDEPIEIEDLTMMIGNTIIIPCT